MRVTGIALQHLRTHKSYVLQFEQPTTLILGPNASGKTTLMESLYLLATGESFRADTIEELIQFSAEIGRVKGKIVTAGQSTGSETTEVEVLLTRGEVQGKKTAKRLFTVNGVRRRKQDAMSYLQVVVFRPEDMRLVEGSPARRRAFLDTPISMVFPEYARAAKTYEQTLRRRNKLLQQVREGEQPQTALRYWDISLLKAGETLQKYRARFLQSLHQTKFSLPFTVQYLPSIISEERMREYGGREIAAGHTLIGPHKDDFSVFLPMRGKKRDVALYGSRGQQRMAVLWLKLGEFAFFTSQTQQQPLLLLDDILSELDPDTRQQALAVVGHCQSVITSTEPEVLALLQQSVPSDTLKVVQLESTHESSSS